ncbi:VapC toxin family PIN domain ribonuclease [Micromonospora matsumotoense]|uniref:VapC toxin family PIN domain ribonuclease n=1 Tax=Micromonospora matsumotoense TaxID=121616 RepID=UPI0034472642
MSRGLLDTSILIANDVIPIPGELNISVASLAERQLGVLVTKAAEARALRLARLSAIQRRFAPLPIDDAIAGSCARLAVRVVEAGRQPRARVMDLLIAAKCRTSPAQGPDRPSGIEPRRHPQ